MMSTLIVSNCFVALIKNEFQIERKERVYFDKGRQARLSNMQRSTNPYNHKTVKRKLWDEGWLAEDMIFNSNNEQLKD